jgi:hypothetical protein
MIKMADGNIIPIEAIQVGDVLPGGIVYAIQKSIAPDMLYDFNGTLMTGGHAVPQGESWTRAKYVCQQVARPAGYGHIYNLGVTRHFIVLGNGDVVGDLHETDKYEYLSAEESLEQMNEALPLRPIC